MASTETSLAHMHALMRQGRTDDAMRHAIATLDLGARAPLLRLARHCAQQGRSALALELLALVGRMRADLLPPLAREPAFAPLRDHPRFLQIIGAL